jgi:hypothetical protein
MIAHDLDGHRLRAVPNEADPPLLVDPDASLPTSIALQGFQPVARWDSEILEAASRINDLELVLRTLRQGCRVATNSLTEKQAPRIGIAEPAFIDHPG